MSIRDRIRELKIKVTDLSELMNISTPTMYSNIEKWDECRYSELKGNIMKLFVYLINSKVTKRDVLRYILVESDIKESMSIVSKDLEHVSEYLYYVSSSLIPHKDKEDVIEKVSVKVKQIRKEVYRIKLNIKGNK